VRLRKVAIFSLLLIAGMVWAQLLPDLIGAAYAAVSHSRMTSPGVSNMMKTHSVLVRIMSICAVDVENEDT
jgi:hypothetical protein